MSSQSDRPVRQRARRVTLADVSRVAGVSKTAASIVLSGDPGTRVSPETADRVRHAATTLGYRPNLTARALATNTQMLIGFVSEHSATERFAHGLIRGAVHEARRHGHMLLIAETEGDPDVTEEAFDALVDRDVEGIIVALTRPTEISLPARASETRVVLLNACGDPELPAILPDEHQGARAIVDLLLERSGAREIVIVGRSRTGPHDQITSLPVQRRLEGIWESLIGHGIHAASELHLGEWTPDTAHRAVSEHLASRRVAPEAVICMNDRLAAGVYRALDHHGLQIPLDVSVASFDDDDIAAYLEPPLTTAALPHEAMGELSVRLLLGGPTAAGEHLVEMPVRDRASVLAESRRSVLPSEG